VAAARFDWPLTVPPRPRRDSFESTPIVGTGNDLPLTSELINDVPSQTDPALGNSVVFPSTWIAARIRATVGKIGLKEAGPGREDIVVVEHRYEIDR
jgi:hypothetical protein